MNKSETGKAILIFAVIAVVITIGALFSAALTRPVPRPMDEEGMEAEMTALSESLWKVDSGSRKTKLREFSYSLITGAVFDKRRESGIIPVTFLTERTCFEGYVRKGENGLLLKLDGATLDLWLSGDETVLTLSGGEEYLAFVK